MSGFLVWPGPHIPDMPSQLMPAAAFNSQVQAVGQRFGWMKSHICACVGSTGTPGVPDSRCVSCNGRGVYWDQPLDFLGLATYMHTSSAPDEPGATTNVDGLNQRSEPTLSIPCAGNLNEATVYERASAFDAFVEYGAEVRFETSLLLDDGQSMVLPYQYGIQLYGVTTYDPLTRTSSLLDASQYSLASGVLSVPDAVVGSSFVAEYTALPIYIAYRNAGGMPHTRPFAQGRTGIPKRFHIVELDLWLRARGAGDGPNSFGPPSG